jgi:flagellar basal body-associated protein FliL
MITLMHKNRPSKFTIGYTLLMCTFAGAGIFALNHLSSFAPVDPVPVHGPKGDLAYLHLPRISVAVGSVGASSSHIKMDIALEVAAKDIAVLQGYEPRITDKINQFLGGLTAEEIERPSTTPWLRAEVLKQANTAGSPVPVTGIVFRSLVIM